MKLEDGANTVSEYEYDGRNKRIVKSIYVTGTLDHRQHAYYNDEWQVLEVRKEVSGTEDSDPLEQYVWHPFHIDAILLRDYDADVNGSSTRYFYCQDANFNVTALTNAVGAVVERCQYTPYGQLEILDADFSPDANGESDVANVVTFRQLVDQTLFGLPAARKDAGSFESHPHPHPVAVGSLSRRARLRAAVVDRTQTRRRGNPTMSRSQSQRTTHMQPVRAQHCPT